MNMTTSSGPSQRKKIEPLIYTLLARHAGNVLLTLLLRSTRRAEDSQDFPCAVYGYELFDETAISDTI